MIQPDVMCKEEAAMTPAVSPLRVAAEDFASPLVQAGFADRQSLGSPYGIKAEPPPGLILGPGCHGVHCAAVPAPTVA